MLVFRKILRVYQIDNLPRGKIVENNVCRGLVYLLKIFQ